MNNLTLRKRIDETVANVGGLGGEKESIFLKLFFGLTHDLIINQLNNNSDSFLIEEYIQNAEQLYVKLLK